MSFAGENIWIIGASSGIGKELAVQLAGMGANLILSARREGELKALQSEIDGNHKIYTLDVSNYEDLSSVANSIASEARIDRVIFLAAIYKSALIRNMDIEFAKQMVAVNLCGAIYLTKAILPIFEKQKSGQIAICGSVASYTGLPNSQPYSATKAAIRNFTESLHAEAPEYIDVKLISPGFVSTPMTAKNNFAMPMIITPQKAAIYITKSLKSSSFEIHFPKKFTLILKILSILPYKIKLFITRAMAKKI